VKAWWWKVVEVVGVFDPEDALGSWLWC